MLILGVNLELPVDDLVNTQLHWRPDFRNGSRRLHTRDNLVLEFSDDRVEEEYGGFSGIQTHGHIVECQGDRPIFPYFHIVLFPKYYLSLLLLGQRRGRIFVLASGLKNILGLVGYRKVNHLRIRKFVEHIYSELDLLI